MGRGENHGPFAFDGTGYVGGMPDAYEAIIVGGGAAGLSAALILGRSCRTTLVFDDGRPRNAVAKRMHGFISRDGTPPLDLLATARDELKRYHSVTFTQGHVEAISGEAGAFEVRTQDGESYKAQRVLLATGVYDALPEIQGLREAWGITAFVCPYCDGWEMRDKRIAVVAKGGKAVELAHELYQWSHDIIVCMQGEDSLSRDNQRWIDAVRARRITNPIRRIRSTGGRIESIEFEGAHEERCDAIFLSAPLRPRYPLVDMLGCKLRADGEIDVDARGRTSVPGVYAAGDAVTTVHQVVLAAASGVCAAMAINEDSLKDDVRRVLT
jgi:thioredoxin reductase